MAMSRDELREHLLASLEAAPELPRESRGDLADVFLDELDAHFMLVPRESRGGRPVRSAPSNHRPLTRALPFFPWQYLLILPLLLLPLAFVLHAHIFPFIILLFVLMRFARFPMWRGRPPVIW